jgi:DnaJ domain
MSLANIVTFRQWRHVFAIPIRSTGAALSTSMTQQYSMNQNVWKIHRCGKLRPPPSDLARRSYFTNGQVTKRDDPYAILGLEWGDGATTAQIRQAFRERAKALHPDVVDTSKMSLDQAHQEFQKLLWAYEALLKHVQADVDHESIEEWRVALWRQSDRIALDRTDVAGTLRKRPAPPAQTDSRRKAYGRELGHPSGKGVVKRGEYLADGTKTKGKLRSSSVGRGQSKWIQSSKPKEYKEWKPAS